MQQSYLVSWEIDIIANSPREAAQKALEIQRKADSMAVVFDTIDEKGESVRVDLLEVESNS